MSIPYTFEEIDNIAESLAARSNTATCSNTVVKQPEKVITSEKADIQPVPTQPVPTQPVPTQPVPTQPVSNPAQNTKLEVSEQRRENESDTIKKLLDDLTSSKSNKKVAEKERESVSEHIKVAGFKVVQRCKRCGDNSDVITTNKSATRNNSAYVGIAVGIAGILAMLL
jgi:FtsZ-interacting cell division protein ZipA